MKVKGWCFSFIIEQRIPFWDGAFEVCEILTKYNVIGKYSDSGEGYWRIILFNTTRKKAEKIMNDLKGKRLRQLDTQTVMVLIDCINFKRGENEDDRNY